MSSSYRVSPHLPRYAESCAFLTGYALELAVPGGGLRCRALLEMFWSTQHHHNRIDSGAPARAVRPRRYTMAGRLPPFPLRSRCLREIRRGGAENRFAVVVTILWHRRCMERFASDSGTDGTG